MRRGNEETYFTYDPLNRLTTEAGQQFNVYHEYDAASRQNVLTTSLSSGYEQKSDMYYEYDAAGRTTKAYSSSTGAVYYIYDAAGNVTQRQVWNQGYSSPALTYTAYMEYDSLNRPVSTHNVNADGSTLSNYVQTYDAAGRLRKCLLAGNDCIYYDYDNTGRATGEVWKSSGGSTIYAFAWDYDAVGNRIYEYKQTSPAVETYYEYNLLNRPLHKHVMPADTYIYYQYDDRWNIVRVDEPTESTYFEYDAASRVTRVGYKHPTLSSYVAETFGYDALGRRTEYTPLGNAWHFAYDAGGNMISRESSTQHMPRGKAGQSHPWDNFHGNLHNAVKNHLGQTEKVLGGAGTVTFLSNSMGGFINENVPMSSLPVNQCRYENAITPEMRKDIKIESDGSGWIDDTPLNVGHAGQPAKAEEKCEKSFTISNEVMAMMWLAWEKSIFNNGFEKAEYGGSIIKEKDGDWLKREIHKGNESEVPANRFRRAKIDAKGNTTEVVEGEYHTHPYKKSSSDYPGMPPSAADFKRVRDTKLALITMAPPYIYAITPEKDGTAGKLCDPWQFNTKWNEGKSKAVGKTFLDFDLGGAKSVAKTCGFCLYSKSTEIENYIVKEDGETIDEIMADQKVHKNQQGVYRSHLEAINTCDDLRSLKKGQVLKLPVKREKMPGILGLISP